MILKEMEVLVGLGPGRDIVSSEIGMVYITSSRKLLRGTETYFAYFRDPGSWQKITFVFNTTIPHSITLGME